MVQDIALTVDEGRTADASRFFAAGQHLIALLDALSESPTVDWDVADLRLGSAVAALQAVGEDAPEGRRAAASAVSGLSLVQSGNPLPSDWSPDAVAHAQDLLKVADERTKLERDGNVVWLDARLKEALATQTPWHRKYYGTVRGTLTGVNVTRGNRASVKPFDGGRVVHVGFPNTIVEEMRDALLHEVQVNGLVRQNDAGRVYYVSAEQVALIDQDVPMWGALFGAVPEITDDLSVNEYLEVLRGED
ncbi:hypothetical protein KM868_10915 [Micrococcus luteus]|uniref:hypothetical protein n=1 Tax=Micrococcus luteus TaxID=1270 RepID=UPI001C245FBF|nr:hypothetical protein [Micrococcus luteus]MBU8764005.1 hypothetical protein [Micrococcus luteus]MCV7494830.1 hypothetical protein [Micrococcus luteus]MCV7541473.1 hypothetical protein [Micrococcus luteus]MCV7630595.1 hypothetical protein [Micrococcus luteus]MCV7744384.1 hypothetical protein [Micrococcus luteus]